MYAQEPVQTNIKDLVIVLVAFVLIGGWALGALGNQDPLWFLPYFNETPAKIVLYRDGCRVEILPNAPGFQAVTQVLNQSLPKVDGYEQGFGLSPDSYKEYTEKWRAVQVTYAKPIKIHVAYRFGSPDTLFIPLNEYFGNSRVVFGGLRGEYWAGALRLKSIQEIQSVTDAIACP